MHVHALLSVFNGPLLEFNEKYFYLVVLGVFLLLSGGPFISVIRLHSALLLSLADTEFFVQVFIT